MDDSLTSRRSAVAGILAAVAALHTSGSFAQTQDVAESVGAEASINPNQDDGTRWGSDGTRELLSSKLDSFFGSATGSLTAVRSQDKNNLQTNGEYLLADQIRLPLFGVASSKVAQSDGSIIYESFIRENPYVDTFIKISPTGDIEGVALAHTQDIIKNGSVVGIEPRITIFFRQASVPADLKATAETVMKDFWSRTSPDLAGLANKMKVVEQRLP